jgi:hypothetical protein
LKNQPLPSFAFFAFFAVQVFAPQSANGKGNGPNRKGRQERKESPAFFSKNHPVPSFAFLASFAVQVFAATVAAYSAFRIPDFALD